MNVGLLREAIADLPNDTMVVLGGDPHDREFSRARRTSLRDLDDERHGDRLVPHNEHDCVDFDDVRHLGVCLVIA